MAAVPYEGHAAAAPVRLNQPEGEATRLLYERHQRKILSFCQHQLGNREEAEDATQITFMNAFRGLKRGTSPEFESAWLYKIAHNVCLTKQRNSYRRRLVEAPSDFELIEEVVPAYDSDSDELFGLTSALRVLPEQQRRALLLREWQGLSYREIADELRLTQGAVEALLFRARRSLADALTNDPSERRGRGRPRTASSSAGSGLAAVKSLLVGGGVKVAATAATVAATSVVVATPAVSHHPTAGVLRTDAADRPALAQPVRHHGRAHRLGVPLALVQTASVQAVAAPHATAKAPVVHVAAAPVVHLPLVAAPRIVAPVAPQHEAIVVPPAPAPPDPPPPPPDEIASDVPAAPVAADPSPPAPAVDETRSAPGQAKRVQTASVVTPPTQTVTVANVNQPASEPPPAADSAPPAAPSWVPPGQAKRDQATAPSDTSTPPAPAPAATDAAADSTFVPPGQAKKADDGAADPGHGQGRGHGGDS
jgi:RNA polymerase sigma factor (sigma-70 family)